MLFPSEVIAPVNKVENEKTARKTDSRNYIDLFGGKFVISDPG